jgi:RHS repeat-associated protein
VRNGVTNYYVYGPGLLYEVTETAATTSTLTYHSDLRGSTVALTDANGNVTDRIEYSAYGAITYRAGTNDTPFLFNGRYGVQTDLNGLLYMQARYYNPYICRFINPDPAGFAGGLNWYAYADGNPVSMIDPFGLGAEEGWGGATATWINRHLVHPLNSVSTTSTTVNFAAYMASSIVGGLGDLLRLGQGTAEATYNAQDGWDVAIGITQDIQRAAGLTAIVGGGIEGFIDGPEAADLGDLGVDISKAELDTLYPRVKLSKGLREEIWERSKSPDGKVYDPSGVEIKPGDPWQAGHIPGDKFSDAQQRAYQEGWDSETWKAYQRDPDIYRPELPQTNLGHQHEVNW